MQNRTRDPAAHISMVFSCLVTETKRSRSLSCSDGLVSNRKTTVRTMKRRRRERLPAPAAQQSVQFSCPPISCPVDLRKRVDVHAVSRQNNRVVHKFCSKSRHLALEYRRDIANSLWRIVCRPSFENGWRSITHDKAVD